MMTRRSSPKTSIVLPVVSILLAAGIFVGDTLTSLEIAAPVLYVAVVLISIRFCEPRSVIFVAAGCMALTLLSMLLTAHGAMPAGLVNTAISLLAIGLTTFLALKTESARFAANALIEADQLRDALIGSVSHELRTPLVSILGGVSVLAQTPTVAKDPVLSSLATGIRDEAIRLNSDIQNLLDAAMITSEGLHSRRDWTDPTDFMDSAVEKNRARYPNRSIALSLGRDLPLLNVDPVLIEQAIGQVIANAAKFSIPPSSIEVTAIVDNDQLVISVRDSGLGLNAEEKKRLTDRFFRGSRHLGKISGSGLGLWIANTFITSSGGKLEAVSEGEHQGTEIRIIFPVSGYSGEAESELQEAEALPRTGGT